MHRHIRRVVGCLTAVFLGGTAQAAPPSGAPPSSGTGSAATQADPNWQPAWRRYAPPAPKPQAASPAAVSPSSQPAALPHGLDATAAKELAPAPSEASALPRPENLTRFDPRTAELKYVEGCWLLTAGDMVLKDFGVRQEEARQALRLVRELGLTERGSVGLPRPVLEYWLVDGQPPRSLGLGLRTLRLDPQSLRIERSQGQWVLREPTRNLINFGPHEEEARQALAVLRKYGFNEVAIVGQAVPSMLVFVNRQDLRAVAAAHHTPKDRMAAPSRTGKPGQEKQDDLARASVYHVPALPPLRQDGGPASAARGGVVRTSHRPLAGRASLEDTDSKAVDERVPFDWRQAKVQRDQGDWKVMAGGYTFASFAGSERDARQALAALQFYRFTEHHRVGVPRPVASYFLVNGQAARGVMIGLASEPFQPDALTVKQVAGRYVIAQAGRTLLDCGERSDEARHMLQVILLHRFDMLCRIGPPGPNCLTFLVRSH